MSTKKKEKKFSGHKRGGKAVVPVIFYAPPQVHRAIKAKAKKLGTSQDAYCNMVVARSLGGSKTKKRPVKSTQSLAEALPQ